MPTFTRETFATDIGNAIRAVDPQGDQRHVVWADEKREATGALAELASVVGGRFVRYAARIDLAGGGAVVAEQASGFEHEHWGVAVWLSHEPVPVELTYRLDSEQIAQLWTPE